MKTTNNQLTISEIIFISIMATTMGIIWWGYTLVFSVIEPFLKAIALNGLLDGVWFMGGTFFAYIIRKPGSGVLGETIAAVIQGFISKWGITSLYYGVIQGLATEFIFWLLRYKRWNIWSMCLASIATAFVCFILNMFWYQFYKLSLSYNLLQLACSSISGIIFAGFGSKLLADKLTKAGVLNQFKIAHDAKNK